MYTLAIYALELVLVCSVVRGLFGEGDLAVARSICPMPCTSRWVASAAMSFGR